MYFLLINSSFSHLSFKFPYAFKLKNKNIFVIHQLGISICDNDFKEIIRNEEIFPDSERITTDEVLSKVTSIFADDQYIFLIMKDFLNKKHLIQLQV